MAEAQKRLPWWLLAGAVLAVLLAAVIGFIETVGRQGTLVGRSEQIRYGMPRTEVLHILGPTRGPPTHGFWYEQHTVVIVRFADDKVSDKQLSPRPGGYNPWPWRIRRWAEQAYTAIHGPRR